MHTRSSMRMLPVCMAATLLLLAATVVHGQDRPDPPSSKPSIPRPTLSIATPDSLYTLDRIFRRVPPEYASFKGVVLEEVLVTQHHPILPEIFFDSASSAIPSRYVLFKSYEETLTFDESNLPAETLEIYYQTLNIIGLRMRRTPTISITIGGSSSSQPNDGETATVAEARSRAVYDYLHTIWRIEETRMTMLPGRDVSIPPRHPRLYEVRQLNRLVEINSPDRPWELLNPITRLGSHVDCYPSSIFFVGKNGVADSLVSHQVLEVKRGATVWNRLTNPGTFQVERDGSHRVVGWSQFQYLWDGQGEGNIWIEPERNDSDFVVQLVVHLRDGNELRSEELSIPALYIPASIARVEYRRDHHCIWTSLPARIITGLRDSLGPVSRRTLEERIQPAIDRTSTISVSHHLDDDPFDGTSHVSFTKLAPQAKEAADLIERAGRRYSSMQIRGYGAALPIYGHDRPEERILNQRIGVWVETRIELPR